MKKLTVCMMTILLLVSLNPMPLKATVQTDPVAVVISKPVRSIDVNVFAAKLNEIKLMDKSNLTQSEKRQLRKESRSIKKYFKAVSGGVYISAGALIIILLLVILLL